MTAADLTLVRYVDDLPPLAAHPDVTVSFNLQPDRLGECGVCCERPDRGPAAATMRILYDQWNQADMATDVCSHEHADEELLWLTGAGRADGNPRNIRLLVLASLSSPAPTGSAETPPTHNFEALLYGLRNEARQGEAWDAVEAFRRAAIEAVSHIDTERRAA
jgi:hypothetical protein